MRAFLGLIGAVAAFAAFAPSALGGLPDVAPANLTGALSQTPAAPVSQAGATLASTAVPAATAASTPATTTTPSVVSQAATTVANAAAPVTTAAAPVTSVVPAVTTAAVPVTTTAASVAAATAVPNDVAAGLTAAAADTTSTVTPLLKTAEAASIPLAAQANRLQRDRLLGAVSNALAPRDGASAEPAPRRPVAVAQAEPQTVEPADSAPVVPTSAAPAADAETLVTAPAARRPSRTRDAARRTPLRGDIPRSTGTASTRHDLGPHAADPPAWVGAAAVPSTRSVNDAHVATSRKPLPDAPPGNGASSLVAAWANAGGSTGAFFAALLSLFILAIPSLGRWLRPAADFCRPPGFVSPLEVPG